MNNAKANLTICSLDVRDKEALENFVQGCDIIINGGSPFLLDVKDPQTELFEPTVQGTCNFLEVISKSSQLKKVVMIASVAAWNTSFPLTGFLPKRTYFHGTGHAVYEPSGSPLCPGKIFSRSGKKIYHR